MPYGELTPLSDDEFKRMHTGQLTPDDFPTEERRGKTHAYLERLLEEAPQEWQSWYELNAEGWLANMRAQNGQITAYNPSGRRFKRKELRVMAQQWASDSMGVAHDEHAATVDELLDRAREMERFRATLSKHGLL